MGDQQPLPFDKPSPPKMALILDTETTGKVEEPEAVIIEVGVILYSLEKGTPVRSYSTLIRREPGTIKDALIPRLTGIWDDDLDLGLHPQVAWEVVAKMMVKADVVIAHNVAFDRVMCERDRVYVDEVKLYMLTPRPWVCSMTQIEWPDREPGASKSLAAAALHYGVGVVAAHRALTDCDILSRTFSRLKELGHDLQELVANAMVPRTKVKALVSYDNRQVAKDHGFAWDGEKKMWWREVTDEQRGKLPFKTAEVR